MVRADRFAALGGFCEPMFAYCEDTDLSLRCWQRGWRVVLVPDAVVLHRYEFSRNPQKLFLLERNRLLMVLTVYSGRLLAAVGDLGLDLLLAPHVHFGPLTLGVDTRVAVRHGAGHRMITCIGPYDPLHTTVRAPLPDT